MLNDPLFLTLPISTSVMDENNVQAHGEQAVALHVRDISDGGSKRRGTMPNGNSIDMTISHSTSNENKPLTTDRSVIRLDVRRVNTLTGQVVTLSVYLVVALPQGGLFTTEDAAKLTKDLASFCLFGPSDAAIHGYSDQYTDTIDRVIRGEP